MNNRWSAEDRRRFADRDRLRASRIPKKRNAGPLVNDWGDLDEFLRPPTR